MSLEGSSAVGAPAVSAERSGAVAQSLDRAIRGVLWLYLATLPFRSLLFIERNAFIVLIVLLLCWSVSHRRLFWVRTPLDVPLLALLGWVALSLPFASFPAYSVKEFGKLLQCVLVFHAVLFFLRDDHNRKGLVLLFVGMTGLMSIYGLIQFDPLHQQTMVSFLPSEVWLTTYLVLFVPLGFGAAYSERSGAVRWLGIGVGLISAVCLVLTRSRAGSIALVGELVLMAYLFRRSKGVMIGALSALVLVGVLWSVSFIAMVKPDISGELVPMNKNVGSVVHRFDIWKFSLSEILKHPIVGIGYGNNTYLMLYGQEAEAIEPGHAAVRQSGTHNVLLYYALHVGLPGLVLFLWLMYRAVSHLAGTLASVRDEYEYGIVAAAVCGVLGGLVRFQFDMMLVGTLAVMYWCLLAIGTAHAARWPRASKEVGVT